MLNYYKILGVNRDATLTEIEQAYKFKARQYHPDFCKNTDSYDRFKDVAEAAAVLRDPMKRSLYDRGLAFGGKEDIWSPQRITLTGSNVYVSCFVPIKNLFHVVEKVEVLRTINCIHCESERTLECPYCFGDGQSYLTETKLGIPVRTVSVCQNCDGRGKVFKGTSCKFCTNGTQVEKMFVQCELYKKTGYYTDCIVSEYDNHKTFIFPNKGNYGRDQNGDICIDYRFDYGRFQRINDFDIKTTVEISFVTLCLGGVVPVDTIDGSIFNLEIPSLCQKTEFTIPGLGLPNNDQRGSLQVSLKVRVPESLGQPQILLLEQLKKSL